MKKYRYYVYFQPLEDADTSVYGDEIDVSDKIEVDGIGTISRSIDAGDYDVGVFTFQELNLKGFNYNGYFNTEDDSRSIFRETRDRCKVRVVFESQSSTRNREGTFLDEDVTETITFRGLINEEATRLDIVTEAITFKVLSRDSVLRNTKVQGGTVNTGMSTTTAMYNILNQPKITAVLPLLLANINPPLELTIDNGLAFNNKSVKDALDELLLATNSVLLIEDDGTIIIQDRSDNTLTDSLNLYGKSDEQGRENIIDINAYNTGRQRMFTAVQINDTEVNNAVFVAAFAYRQKAIRFDWLTDAEKEAEVAGRLVDEFKFPKIELNVKVATETARSVKLLDPVSINYPLRVKPIENTFLPVVGDAEIDDAMTPLPYTFGAIEIKPRVSFKVIGIDENPNEFTTTLKLRQTGKSYGDGYFDQPGNCKISFAIVGEAKICIGDDPCETWNPSVVAAALVGCTVLQ